MSEHPYTPTTDEVAEVWAMSEPNPEGYTSMGLPVPDETEQRAEFDRWLDQVKADAWDEGWVSRHNYDERGGEAPTPNPYESEEDRHVDQ